MISDLVKIVRLLSNKEKSDFRNVIKNKKNERLNGLFSYLSYNTSQPIDKTHLFRSVYGEVYDVSKDYLLRNEQRLLKRALVNFLSTRQLSAQEHQINFLKFLSQHKLDTMFDKEARKLKKSLAQNGDLYLLKELAGLSINNFYRNQLRGSQEDFVYLNELLHEWNTYSEEDYLLQNRRLGVFQAFINEGFFRMGIDEENHIEQMPFDETQSSASQYYWYKAKSLSDQDKIKYLNLALEYLKKASMNPELKRDEHIVITNNLSLQYFFNRSYDKSVGLYENLIKTYDLPKNKEVLVMFNYVSALVKSQKHVQADVIFRLYYRKMERLASTRVKAQLLCAMNYLSLGDLKSAKEMLPQNLKQGSHDDYLYARLVWAIYYYLKSDLDSCERENQNLIQSVQSKSQFRSYVFCAQSMNALLRYPNSKQLKKLSNKVSDFVRDKSIRHSDILPLLWLKKELNKQLE